MIRLALALLLLAGTAEARPFLAGGAYTRGSAATSPPTPEASTDAERCTNLGSQCICFEPQNTTSYPDGGAFGLPDYKNPADSPSETQCTYLSVGVAEGYSLYDADDSNVFPVAETGMPVGNTVDFVLHTDRTSTHAINAINTDNVKTQGKLCVRSYQKLDSDFEAGGVGTCEGNKWMEIGWLGQSIQLGQRNSLTEYDLRVTSDSGTENMSASGSVPLDHCRGEWCIAEICLDPATGDVSTGSDYTITGYIRRVSTGAVRTFGPSSFPSGQTVFEFTSNLVGVECQNMWRRGTAGTTCAGGREFSHCFVADPSPDPFIGCVESIEPGCVPGSASGL